jgi:cob(I)alamin adenosyltransferase
VRAKGAGMKVAWVAFYKQASWKLGEIESMKQLGIDTYLLGKGFHIKSTKYEVRSTKVKTAKIVADQVVVDGASEDEHKEAAKAALTKAQEVISKVDLLVLDEVNNAVHDTLIEWVELEGLLSNRGKTHVVLTGRDASKALIEAADLVTEMTKIKHPYDEGKLAVRGLDF